MPYRKSYKPYRRNYGYVAKKKWAPLMRDIPLTNYSIPANATDGSYITIVDNSTEASTPTPTIIKCKNLKVSLDVAFDATVLNNGFLCLIFVPQGITPVAGMAILHPEWVMAWRNIPNDISASHHNVMLQTSLSRNLNSGDRIVIHFTFYNAANGPTNLSFTGRYSGVVRNN